MAIYKELDDGSLVCLVKDMTKEELLKRSGAGMAEVLPEVTDSAGLEITPPAPVMILETPKTKEAL